MKIFLTLRPRELCSFRLSKFASAGKSGAFFLPGKDIDPANENVELEISLLLLKNVAVQCSRDLHQSFEIPHRIAQSIRRNCSWNRSRLPCPTLPHAMTLCERTRDVLFHYRLSEPKSLPRRASTKNPYSKNRYQAIAFPKSFGQVKDDSFLFSSATLPDVRALYSFDRLFLKYTKVNEMALAGGFDYQNIYYTGHSLILLQKKLKTLRKIIRQNGNQIF